MTVLLVFFGLIGATHLPLQSFVTHAFPVSDRSCQRICRPKQIKSSSSCQIQKLQNDLRTGDRLYRVLPLAEEMMCLSLPIRSVF